MENCVFLEHAFRYGRRHVQLVFGWCYNEIRLLCCPSSGIFEKLGQSVCQKFYFFLYYFLKATKSTTFVCIFHQFSQKTSNLSKIRCFPNCNFFHANFWSESVPEGNPTDFILAILHIEKHFPMKKNTSTITGFTNFNFQILKVLQDKQKGII